jgi:hypothetical protein
MNADAEDTVASGVRFVIGCRRCQVSRQKNVKRQKMGQNPGSLLLPIDFNPNVYFGGSAAEDFQLSTWTED